jgi:DNA-binding HxlR family transcriptional regulator
MKLVGQTSTAAALGNTLSVQQSVFVREFVAQVSEKWALWTLSVLTEAGGPMRFSRVMERVEGVSQKSLAKTLRELEGRGLLTRVAFPEVPPRVEYELTELGRELFAVVHPIWLWTVANVKKIEATHEKLSKRTQGSPRRSLGS